MRIATQTPGADEIRLDYTIEAGPDNLLSGTRGVAYYTHKDYQQRQKAHGLATYPEPAKTVL